MKLLLLIGIGLLLAKCSIGRNFRTINSKGEQCQLEQRGAVVVMYHRFAEEKYPSTSVSLEMLDEHIQFFRQEKFAFISLQELVSAISSGTPLAEKSVAITIDDAYRSVIDKAHPIFMKNNIPYTVFVSTDGVERGFKDFMTWEHLRQLANNPLVSLEAHGHLHAHMVNMTPEERERDIKQSVSLIHLETGTIPQFFSYPFGETSLAFVEEVKGYRWKIGGQNFSFKGAFATNSGGANCSSNLFALPRFALNMNYGKVSTLFAHKMNSLPFPLRDFSPSNLSFCSSREQRKFTLTVPEGYSLASLSCFASNGKNTLKIEGNTAKIELENPLVLPDGRKGPRRERLNCTLPSGERGRFFWFGREFTLQKC